MKTTLVLLAALALLVVAAPLAAALPPAPNVCQLFGTGSSPTDPVHCFGLCDLGPDGPTCRD